MTIVELMKIAPGSNWLNEDGERIQLAFLPGMSEDAIAEIEVRLGAKLPIDLLETMKLCSGIDGLDVEIDFTTKFFQYGHLEGLNRGFGFAHDGFGNYWYADVLSEQELCAQVFFLSHDPPEIDYSHTSISAFLEDAVNSAKEPDRLMDESGTNGRTWAEPITHSDALEADDAMRGFATSLSPDHVILDLGNPTVYGSIDYLKISSDLSRHSEQRIFAYVPKKKSKGLFSRLFGR